ncbi:hypothetical protein M9H77_03261 [Catharanthus roseus]|uniref:Uncharacterized protein n=1 Tax=Catharanthus roseus TaxID=4058 RepID=A0ACC0CB82_CATRO|nr:hypothetical protein M9H77_03261 [Catharanthus roseus]
MLVAVQKVIQDLVADVQRTVPGYQVDANNAQVIQAPALSYGHRGRVTKIWQMIPKDLGQSVCVVVWVVARSSGLP